MKRSGGSTGGSGKHTILLLQPRASVESRTYNDYESVNDCLRGLMTIYEDHLATSAPRGPKSAPPVYDSQQLFRYLDSFNDLSALVYDDRARAYIPYGRDWVKSSLYRFLESRQQ